ncbi:MAG: hypothetical protein KAH86_06095 [Methanosarcinales archaeon]|nr:hypothetical protein [Methanosarcinales archaeon]
MELKNIFILFMVVSFLTLSGCAGGPAEDSANEPVVDETSATSDIESGAAPVDNLAALKTKLLAEGYNVTYIEEVGKRTPQGVQQTDLVIHVATRDNARYDLVDMAAIAYEYYPDKDMYSTKADGASSSSSGPSALRSSYFVEKGAIVAYINGAMDKDDVKVR